MGRCWPFRLQQSCWECWQFSASPAQLCLLTPVVRTHRCPPLCPLLRHPKSALWGASHCSKRDTSPLCDGFWSPGHGFPFQKQKFLSSRCTYSKWVQASGTLWGRESSRTVTCSYVCLETRAGRRARRVASLAVPAECEAAQSFQGTIWRHSRKAFWCCPSSNGTILPIKVSSKEGVLDVCKNSMLRSSIIAELIKMNSWKQWKEAG